MKKLTNRQRTALQWLQDNGPWEAPWWGGRPHGRWPKELTVQSYNSLSLAKLIETRQGHHSNKIVSITQDGRAAIFTIGSAAAE